MSDTEASQGREQKMGLALQEGGMPLPHSSSPPSWLVLALEPLVLSRGHQRYHTSRTDHPGSQQRPITWDSS